MEAGASRPVGPLAEGHAFLTRFPLLGVALLFDARIGRADGNLLAQEAAARQHHNRTAPTRPHCFEAAASFALRLPLCPSIRCARDESVSATPLIARARQLMY